MQGFYIYLLWGLLSEMSQSRLSVSEAAGLDTCQQGVTFTPPTINIQVVGQLE